MPEPSLANVAGLACQGKAVPGAASFTDSPEAIYHIFIANMDGSPSPWNKRLPQSLSAKGIADLNAVLCIDTQVPDTETFDCGSYRAVNTVATVPLKVGRYLLHTRLVSAVTGETIFDYQVQGQRAECPQNLDTSDPHVIDSVLYGDKIDIQDVIDQQLPYFLPKSALIPLGKSLGTDDTSWDESLMFRVSPDARLLASVPIIDRANLQVWDVKTQNKIFARKGHNPGISTIDDVVFSPDGKSLVSSGCNSDFSCEAFLWDIQSGYPLYSLLNLNPENESIRAGTIAFSPDGKELAAITSGGVTLWDAASGKRLQTIPLEKQGLSTLFTPDGTGLLFQDSAGSMKIWDVQSGMSRVDLETWEPYFGLAFTSDG
ncbi:MAG TPA: hypothetical protein VKP08_18195, partial [Anaerolineales bacterium]|nr:hypothetical protein [Anaerolineales bacterium]